MTFFEELIFARAIEMITAATVATRDLNVRMIEQMYALFSRYYDDTTPKRFETDLKEKDSVILLWDQQVCGFSTILSYPYRYNGRDLIVVFSGDTIIDRPYWGTQILASAWIREVGAIARRNAGLPLYWLLIVKGHRTFRYLSSFAINFIPCWTESREAFELTELRDALARERFGPYFDVKKSIVRFPKRRGRLSSEWAMPSKRERQRSDVDFFLRSNPGYLDGDELVCLCELEPHNMRPLTRRLFQQGYAQ